MLHSENDNWKVLKHPMIREGAYAVSDFGEVMNLHSGTVLSKVKTNRGYYIVQIVWENGEKHGMLVHRLVAMMFVDGRNDEKDFVNHKNGIKTDCRACNLEWVTQAENTQHAYAKGLIKPSHTLPESDMDKICKSIVENEGIAQKVVDAMSKIGIRVSINMIQQIKRKNVWTKISDKYFDKEKFAFKRHFTEKQIRHICELLVKYNGSIKRVHDEVIEDIPFATYPRISAIKTGRTHRNISKEYFDCPFQ